MPKDFILASGSKQRLELLKSIDFEPKKVIPADIDETPKKGEKPTAYVKRMALEKGKAVSAQNSGEVVLAADTIVVSGTKIIQKSKTGEEQAAVMRLLSGRSHRVITAVCVVNAKGRINLKTNTTRLIIKKMSELEIKEYIDSNEWVGCSGYNIEGRLQYLAKKIIGSWSGVIGLPLYEAKNMLNGAGIK